MATVNMLEAKSSLSRLVEAVESGAEREIIIARNGKPAAKLVGIESGSGGKRLGVARGKFKVPKSIDEHNDEVAKLFWEYLRGMQILLDTHVLLWALTDDAALKGEARVMLVDERNVIWVSAVSIWEISIKHSLRRGDMPLSGKDALTYCRKAGYRWLDIRPEHAVAVEDLPLLHADPFDRLLVAQALTEPMKLLTRDAVIARYHPDILLI